MAGLAGVLGTFMGMYNTWEIEKLKGRLNVMDKNHNLLVHVTQRQEEQVHRITENMNSICVIIQKMMQFNPTLIAEQITAQIDLFATRLTMATNAVQQLQHRRLAVDFLDTTQLEEMHKAISDIATERGYTLLPERLADYFQLEASYLRDGKDINILLHVPCIIHEQLLTIYKYIPLPFPIPRLTFASHTTIQDLIDKRTTNNTVPYGDHMDALIIKPEAEMIAVSNKEKFQIITEGDLAACIKRNRIYLCEQHQVLHTDLTNSCLGSIYANFEKGIKDNCKLERKKLLETVYQLNANEYLIFTPQPYKATITCKSGTNHPVHLTTIYKLIMPEECELILKSHTITSDYNIRITPPPLNVPWSLDPMRLPADILLDAALIDQKFNDLRANLGELLNETSRKTNFKEMLNDQFGDPTTYPWYMWASSIAGASAFGLLIFWYCYNKKQEQKYMQQQMAQQYKYSNHKQQQPQQQTQVSIPEPSAPPHAQTIIPTNV